MTKKTTPPDQLGAEAREFRDQYKTLLLSTASTDGYPDSSYAPYVSDNAGNLYIFVSELAQHTRNLMTNSRAGVLFIDDEKNSRNLFARKRISLYCTATEIPRESAEGNAILAKMQESLGKTIALLQQLPDFHLFKLGFDSGSYIRGFGEAYSLADATLEIDSLRKS